MARLVLHKGRVMNSKGIGYDIMDDSPIIINNTVEEWVRPGDWISVPTPSLGTEVAYILLGVYPKRPNFLTISAAGAFVVDWGDGATDTVSSGGYSRKEYMFDSVSGTPTSEGFKLVLITITPVISGTFTSLNLQQYHSYQVEYDRLNILEMKMSAPYMTSLNIGNSVYGSQMDKIRSFEFVGTHSIANTSYMFSGCTKLVRVKMHLGNVVNATHMFSGCLSMTDVQISNSGGITNMQRMFQYCYSLKVLPVISANSCTDMSYMFYNCYSLEETPIIDSSSNVLNTEYMYNGCKILKRVRSFDTSKVTNMNYMFEGCIILGGVDLFDMSKVTTAKYMFSDCRSISILPFFNLGSLVYGEYMFAWCSVINDTRTRGLPLFDLRNLKYGDHMFYGCGRVKIVPNFNFQSLLDMKHMFAHLWQVVEFPQFNTPLVTNMSYSFQECRSMLNFPLINTSSVTDMSYMFYNCHSLRGIANLDTSNVTDMSYMFRCEEENASRGGNLYSLPALNTSKVTNMGYFLSGQTRIKYFPIIDTSKVTNTRYMFWGCMRLLEFPTLNWSSLSTANGMFQHCYGLKKVGALNMPKVSNMSEMFKYCYQLREIGEITTSSSYLWGLYGCFHDCHKLKKVNLFDTGSVGDFNHVFYRCRSMVSIPSFNTSNVSDMYNAFRECDSLLSAPGLTTSNVTRMQEAFRDCISLEVVPFYDMRKVDNSYAMFYSCLNLVSATFSFTASAVNMNASEMFWNCFNLEKVSMVGAIISNASGTFTNCNSLRDVGTFSVSSTNCYRMFNGCAVIDGIKDIKFLNPISSASEMFYECNDLTETPFINLSGVPDISNMDATFRGCRSLNTVNATGSRWSVNLGETGLDWPGISNFLNNMGNCGNSASSFINRYVQLSGCPGTIDMIDINKRKIVFEKGYTYSHPNYQGNYTTHLTYPWENLAYYSEMGNTFSYPQSGPTVFDISGYSYPVSSSCDASILGNPAYSTKGIILDGLDDGILVGTHSATVTSIHGYFTIFAVIEPISLVSGATVSIIGRWGSTDCNNYYLDFTDRRLRFGFTSKPNSYITTRTERQRVLNMTFVEGQRYFIAASWNWGDNGCAMWVNGKRQTSFYSDNIQSAAWNLISVTSSTAPTSADSTFSIGYNQNSVSMGGSGYHSNIKVFSAGLYQRVLSDRNIEELHSYYKRIIP